MPTPDPDGERIAHLDAIEAWGKRWPDPLLYSLP